MSQLAIKGHATRGNELIELLEMLGGKNKISSGGLKWFDGTNVDSYYTIEEDNHIYMHLGSIKGDYIIFTLEEFLEQFTFKVGDKVYNIIHNENQTITNLVWHENEVIYQTNNNEFVYVNYLRPYKEEIMKYNNNFILTGKINTVIFQEQNYEDKVELDLGNDYEIKVEDGKTYVVKKKTKYPKNYKDCCDALGLCTMDYDANGHKLFLHCFTEIFNQLQELLIARNAYWKIAGEQMGLGKLYEPDWKSSDLKYVIKTMGNTICNTTECSINCILAFPTKEMREEFYENFKSVIESCKELL